MATKVPSLIIPDCLSCGEQMTLEKVSGLIQGKGSRYKRRRYVCAFCGYTETVVAGGEIDILMNPVKIEKPEKSPLPDNEEIKQFLTRACMVPKEYFQ